MFEISIFEHALIEDHKLQLSRAIQIFNDAQNVIELVSSGECDLPMQFANVVAYGFTELKNDGPFIVATSKRLSDNWFSHTKSNKGVFTLADYDVAFLHDRGASPKAAPDAIILTSLALTAAQIIAGIEEKEILHSQTVGCLFDFCADKRERSFKMRSAYLCSNCLSEISKHGVSSIEVDAILAVLECVRSLLLGRSPQGQTIQPRDTSDDKYLEKSKLPKGISIPPMLKNAVKSGNLSVLVGSGLSLQNDVKVHYENAVDWDSLPSWSDVLLRMGQCTQIYTGRVRAPNTTETLEEFLAELDVYRSILGSDRYYPRAINDIFYPGIESAGMANRLLFRLNAQWILTTNYDAILQHSAQPGTPVFTWKEAKQAREFLKSGGNHSPIVKLHGCASRTDTVILTNSEYLMLRTNKEYLALLTHVFSSRPVLFIGFGFTDPFDLEMALSETSLAGAAAPEQFAILPESRSGHAKDKFPNLQVISYQEHDQIPAILAELIDAI